MGLNSLLTYYKKKVKKKSKDVNLKDCVNTVTCGFENILQQNAFVTLRRPRFQRGAEREVNLTKLALLD